jgi:outer membrane protein TolC
MTRYRVDVLAFLIVFVAIRTVAAQTSPAAPLPPTLTIEDALRYAVDHYPAVRAAVEQVNASTAGVLLARTAYLPKLDGVWQSNRATANNIFGQLLPQSTIPAISGPVLLSASATSVWGTAAGALFSWEPFDMGLRQSTVMNAEAFVARARADETLTRLDVQGAVGAAFLAVVAAERTVASLDADVERRDVLAQVARTLADNDLRPGAEASRAEAERAAARTRALQARQVLAVARVTLAKALGAGDIGSVDGTRVLNGAPPSARSEAGSAPSAHPYVRVRQSVVESARAQEDVLAHMNRPRLFLQSSVFARGSGGSHDGSLDGGISGLGFDRANWAAGVQVTFPNLFEAPSLRARKAVAAASTRAELARADEALLAVSSQQRVAAAMVETARAIAANTPIQLEAARQSEAQARARFQAGLASIVEVADAQGLLTEAEQQDALARIDVWRALLAEAVASGDLSSFVGLVRAPDGRR